MISKESIKSKLKFEEGFRSKAYHCSAGKLTVGYGYNLDAPGAKTLIDRLKIDWEGLRRGRVSITPTQAGILLEAKIEGCLKALQVALPWFDELSDARQLVLVDMAYQMGVSGLMDFEMMLAALRAKDYKRAAVEMLDSKYAKKDSPNRAKRNFDLLVKG